MKIKNIISVLKQNKHIEVLTGKELNPADPEDGRVEYWISGGKGFYKLDERIALKEAEQWLLFLDVPENKYESWYYSNGELPHFLSFEDNELSDEPLELQSFNVSWRGNDFRFLTSENKVFTIKEEYLKPFYGESTEYLNFHARGTFSGDICVAIKIGFILQAVVMPFKLEETVEFDVENMNKELVRSIESVSKKLSKQMTDWQNAYYREERKAE